MSRIDRKSLNQRAVPIAVEVETRLALDGHLKRVLRPLFWGLAAMYGAISLAWFLGARADVPAEVALLWLTTGALASLGALLVERTEVPAKWAHPALLVIILSALNNVFWLIGITRNFVYTPVLYLILLGTAVLFLSLRYFLVVTSLAFGGWIVEAALWGAPDVSVKWGFTLFAAVIIAIIAQVMRVRTYTRLEDLRRLDAARIQQEAELKHSRAEASERTRLLNLTAHEIATPLTPIILRLRTLQADRERLSASGAAALTSLERNFNRLHAAIQDVAAAISEQPPRSMKVASHALHDVLRGAVDEAQKLSHAPVSLLSPRDLNVVIDAEVLTQIVRRLVQSADLRTGSNGRIEVSASLNGPVLEITVADDGHSIPADQVPGIFQPLSQPYDPMQKTGSDLGLGLHLAKIQVARLGGTLDMEPGTSNGSRFIVRIPLG